MAVPGNWVETLKKCKFYADALDKATTELAATTKAFQARSDEVVKSQGSHFARGSQAETVLVGNDPKASQLKKKMDELAKTKASAPGLLKKELETYAKLLAGPDLKGSDGKGKGIPADILKAHKEGEAYIKATKAKYKV